MKNIAFHGVPRSGTTWIGAILDSSRNVAYRHQPLFSYTFKSFLSETSEKEDIRSFFNLIKESADDFILQKGDKKNRSIPIFEKDKITHVIYKEVRYHNILANLLEKDKDLKVIGIIRNPKSVISSWYQAPKEFKQQEWSLMEEWQDAKLKNAGRIEEFNGYNKWKEVALLFLRLEKTYPDRFYLIRYSEFLENTTESVRNLFKFCELDFTSQTVEFLYESNNRDLSAEAYSVFRKNQVDNKWRSTLPKSIVNKIDTDLKGSLLEIFNT